MLRQEPTTRNTLEQGRAQHAYETAKGVRDKDKFASYAKKMPMMIKTNGLGATLAFAKPKNDWEDLFTAVEKWLKLKKYIENNALEEILHMDSASYRVITNEVLAYLSWLRRFAEGFKSSKS